MALLWFGELPRTRIMLLFVLVMLSLGEILRRKSNRAQVAPDCHTHALLTCHTHGEWGGVIFLNEGLWVCHLCFEFHGLSPRF